MYTRGSKFVRTDIWREGKWLDMWSVVHVLSGVSIGLGLYFLHLGAVASLALTFVSLVAYELWEAMVKIEEAPTNRCMDVVVGMVGFVPTFFLVAPILSTLQHVLLFVGILIANITMAAIGWHASQKAAELERRMYTRFAAQRAHFIARQRKLRAQFKQQ